MIELIATRRCKAAFWESITFFSLSLNFLKNFYFLTLNMPECRSWMKTWNNVEEMISCYSPFWLLEIHVTFWQQTDRDPKNVVVYLRTICFELVRQYFIRRDRCRHLIGPKCRHELFSLAQVCSNAYTYWINGGKFKIHLKENRF